MPMNETHNIKLHGQFCFTEQKKRPGEEDAESSCEQLVVPLRKQEYQRAGDLLRSGSLKFTQYNPCV